jgi:hypothetical protein
MVEEVEEEVGWPARAKDLEGGDERRTNNPAPQQCKERRGLNKRSSLFHVSQQCSAKRLLSCLHFNGAAEISFHFGGGGGSG